MGAINGQANIGLRGEARIGKTMWPFSRKNGTYFAEGKPGEGRGWGDGKRVTMEWHANREWIVWGKSSTALTIGNLSPRNHSLDKQVLPPLPFFPNPLWMCSLSNSVFQTDPPVGPSSKIFPESRPTRWMDFSKEKRSLKNESSPPARRMSGIKCKFLAFTI